VSIGTLDSSRAVNTDEVNQEAKYATNTDKILMAGEAAMERSSSTNEEEHF
jgi:hypothetical protein